MKHLAFLLRLLVIIILPLQASSVTKLNPTLLTNEDVLANSVQFPLNIHSSHIVYRLSSSNPQQQLFSVDFNVGPTSTVNLNGAFITNGAVSDFLICSNGEYVVFRGDKENNDVLDLFSVPITGGEPMKLNSFLIFPGGDVNSYDISPDSSRVVYVADQQWDNRFELYSVSIQGGTVTKLNLPFASPEGDVINTPKPFAIDRDSSRVVYRADQGVDNEFNIYSVAITGGPVTQLNASVVQGGDVDAFKISPNGSHVVYGADQEKVNKFEIYSAPILGGPVTKLNLPLVPGGNVAIGSFEISPDSSRAVYLADQENEGDVELYSVLLNGDLPVKLNGSLVQSGDVAGSFPNPAFRISPDSKRVIYRADQDTNDVFELYTVPIGGGATTKLNNALVPDGDVYQFKITSDSSRVVYGADQDTNNVFEVYSIPITGGIVTKLNSSLPPTSDIGSFEISPDGGHVVYLLDSFPNIFELFEVPITGGSNTKLTAPFIPGGSVAWDMPSFIHPSGGTVIYVADQETDNINELYATALLPPLITSSLNVVTSIGTTNFSYTITAQNGPITGYGTSELPPWAKRNNNVITGNPTTPGNFLITLFATNDIGFDTKVLNLTVNASNVIITPPSITGFNGDFDGDGALDLLAQKKKKVSLINFSGSNGVDISRFLSLNKGDRVRAANLINSNNTLIIQNKTQVKALLVDSNFNSLSNINVGLLTSPKIKVVASGDINGDQLADIVTQQGKTISAFVSPDYFYSTVVNMKTRQKVVGVIANIGTLSNSVSSILLQKGKKLFFYDIPTNAPFLSQETLESAAGPIFDKAYKVVGVLAGTNIATAQLIIKRGKKINAINYGTTSFDTPLYKLPKNAGKLVGPQ